MAKQDIRWQQRFDNFRRAFSLLEDALQNDPELLNQLEKEGVIQRFEYTFELAWKCLKDKMEYDGFLFEIISPKSIIRQAYTSKYIVDADKWFKMIGDRNLMSHTYDPSLFEQIIQSIWKEYLPSLKTLYLSLEKQLIDENA